MKNVIYLLLVFGVTFSACQKENNPPSIQQITVSPQEITIGETAILNCTAIDADGEMLIYSWTANAGSFVGTTTGISVTWKAPDYAGNFSITVSVSDGKSVTEQTKSIKVIVPSSEVTGYVYFSGTTIPVSGVIVKIGAFQSTTSSEGTFSIKSKKGIQQIQAIKDGFDLYSKNIDVTNTNYQIIIEMTSGTYTSKVFGNIKNDKGFNIAGVTVVLLNPDGKDSNLRTTTDVNGYYQLLSIPQGTRVIRFLPELPNEYGKFEATLSIANNNFPYSTILLSLVDYITFQNKRYKIQKIGNQWWMAENLAYLPAVYPSSAESDTEPRYYVYGYNGTDVSAAKQFTVYYNFYTTYGVLYNWRAALAACPPGWHLPSDDEWTELENYLIANGFNYDGTITGNKIAKSMAATTNWRVYSTNNSSGMIGTNPSSNNKSGFSALPGGYHYISGQIGFEGQTGLWWSSTENFEFYAWSRGLHFDYSFVSRGYHKKEYGFSVRCVRDN